MPQRISTFIAIAFGLLTIFIGGQTLLGYSDPGYVVFLPLLIFNTLMGFVYTATGFLIWQHHKKALFAAKGIFLLNLAVLLIIFILYLMALSIAIESFIAMTLRTVVWLIIFASLLRTKN